MSAASTLSSVVNVLFGILQFVLGAAILALPLITLKQPAAKSKKLMMLLSIAAIGVLVLSFAAGTVSTIILISSLGAMNGTNVASMLLALVTNVFGAILALAFPLLANAMKKEIPVLGVLLALPVIQCISAIITNIFGNMITGLPGPMRNVPAIIAQILVIIALAIAAVWYLTGQKRTLSLVAAIAPAAVFVIAFVLSIFAAKTYWATLGAMNGGFLSYITSSTQFFSAPQRFLLLLLTAMGIRALGTPKAPAYVAPQVPQYPQYPQNPQF